jgi:signal transduction histidine kinase
MLDLRQWLNQIYWKISLGGRSITLGFMVAIATITGVSMVSFQNATELTEDAAHIQETYENLSLLNDISTLLIDAESARRGYFLFNRPTELQRYQAAAQDIQPKLSKLQQALDDPQSQTYMQQFRALTERRLQLFQQSIDAYKQYPIEFTDENPLFQETSGNWQQFQQLITAFQNYEKQRLQRQLAGSQQTLRSRIRLELIGSLLTLIILLAMYFILRRQRIRRQQAEAKQRVLAQQKELSEMKLEFFSMISHEFRTPLSLILGSAQLLKDALRAIVEPAKLKNLQRIQSSAKFMSQQLEDVLVVARADAGKLEFHPKPLEIQTFCLNLVEDFQTFSDPKRLIKFTQQGQATHATVDEKLLYSILSNLLTNAIKYSIPETPIHFTLHTNPNAVTFQIQDHGIGIAPEDQPHLYEPFQRGKNTQGKAGSGLGLSVVKKCVDLHQGTIEFTSEVGRGTLFTVVLPNWEGRLG